mgnify:CR=1 FL=1
MNESIRVVVMDTSPGTALILVEPGIDPRVLALVDQVTALLGYAELRVIQTDADLRPATDDLVLMGDLKKTILEKRKEYTDPIEAHLQAVKAAFAVLLVPLAEADGITRQKIKDYRIAVQKRIDELAAIEAERLKLANMEAAAHDGVHTQDLTPIEKPIVVDRVSTYIGMAGMARIRKWELIDKSLVPLGFLQLDTTAIGKAVRGGIGNIPGIRIYQDESLRVRPH